MTEEQIKEMYLGIINNGEKWERKANYSDDCEWQPYKLGEGIHEDWEYRKVEKKTWLEEYLKVNCDSKIEAHNSKIDIENVCKKILEEVRNNCFDSWLPVVRDDVGNVLEHLIKDLGIEL